MPYLKEQVDLLMTRLRAAALNEKKYQAGRFEGLAVDVIRSIENGANQVFPGVRNSSNEAEAVDPDDTYPIVIWNRNLSNTYTNLRSFGDDDAMQKQVAEMKMVVYGKWSALQMTTEELEQQIVIGFPDRIPKAQIDPYNLRKMVCKVISTNLKSEQVFNEEFRNTPFRISHEDLFFSVRYTIESTYDKGCFVSDCS